MRSKIEYTGNLIKIKDLHFDINNPPQVKIGEFFAGSFYKMPEVGAPFSIKMGDTTSFRLSEVRDYRKLNNWESIVVSGTNVYRLSVISKTRHYLPDNPIVSPKRVDSKQQSSNKFKQKRFARRPIKEA